MTMLSKFSYFLLVCLLAVFICSGSARALRGLQEDGEGGGDLEEFVPPPAPGIPTATPVTTVVSSLAPTPIVPVQPTPTDASDKSVKPTTSTENLEPTIERSAIPTLRTEPTLPTISKIDIPVAEPSEDEQEKTGRPTVAKVVPPTVAEIEAPQQEPPTGAIKTKAPIVAETEAPVTNAPTVAKTDAPATNAPTVAKTDAPATNAPTVAETDAPVTNAPTVAETDAPVTNAPTTAKVKTNSPTLSDKNQNVPVVEVESAAPTVKKTVAPSPIALADTPTPNDPVVAPPTTATTPVIPTAPDVPTTPTNTDTGAEVPVETTEPEDLSNSTTTFILVFIIGTVAFVMHRMYCKSSTGPVPPGESSSGNSTSYSRLAQSEEAPVDDFDELGDIEMHGGGGSHGFGNDDAEIWEEWETNEEVNPPSLQQVSNSYINSNTSNSAPKVTSNSNFNSTPEYSRSASLDDPPAFNVNSRSTSNGGFNTLPSAPIPNIPAPLSGGNLAGSLGSLAVKKPTNTGIGGLSAAGNSNTGSSGASKAKRGGLTPPADVDLFASIGISAAPKFNQPAIGSFAAKTAPKAPASSTIKRVSPPPASAPPVASRVSAITSYDAPGDTWDDDKELDDLIGDD